MNFKFDTKFGQYSKTNTMDHMIMVNHKKITNTQRGHQNQEYKQTTNKPL